MICSSCGTEFSDAFKFCPQCGKGAGSLLAIQTATPATKSSHQDQSISQTGIKGGTVVFGAFAVISLIVSIVNGLIPIYLIEAAAWGGLAWYWQSKRAAHSEMAKAIVFTIAAVVAIGEVIHIVVRSTASRHPTPLIITPNTTGSPPGLDPSQSTEAASQARQSAEKCPTGVPAGLSVQVIPNLASITGADAKIEWHDWGYSGEPGFYNGWYLAFNVDNEIGRQELVAETAGYCLTGVQYEATLQSDHVWKATGRETEMLAEPLTPGRSRQLYGLKLAPHGQSRDTNLVSWKITKAWGFPLAASSAVQGNGTSQ